MEKFTNALVGMKSKLEENYDKLVDIQTLPSGEEKKVLNKDKLYQFLKENGGGLNQVLDEIKLARTGTLANDMIQ